MHQDPLPTERGQPTRECAFTMKKILAAAVLTVAMIPAAHAVTITNNFTVAVNLTSQCRALASGTLTSDFGTYTAFGAAASAPAISVNFECTRGFAPTSVAFDTVGADSTAAGVGVIAGLQYTLTAAAGAVVAGTAASSTTIGTGDTRPYSITGTMPAGQAGTGAGGAATQVRQLIVSY
jgi:hypothetical protein